MSSAHRRAASSTPPPQPQEEHSIVAGTSGMCSVPRNLADIAPQADAGEEPSIIVAGTSGSSVQRKATYNSFEFSPFKEYLTISDSLIMTRKTPRLKSKVPPALSGKDFHQNLLKMQNEKERQQIEKERRKEERERKKAEKEKAKKGRRGNKRKRNESDDSSDPDAIVMDTDSDNMDREDENICFACLGNEGLDEGSNWIGCNKCSRWYHRTCLSEEIENMTNEELVAFNFVCALCTESENRKKK